MALVTKGGGNGNGNVSNFIPFWTTIDGKSPDGKSCGVLFNADPKFEGMTDTQALYMLQNYTLSVEVREKASFALKTPDNVIVGFINNVDHSLTDKSKPTTKAKLIAVLEQSFRELTVGDINQQSLTDESAAAILDSIPTE